MVDGSPESNVAGADVDYGEFEDFLPMFHCEELASVVCVVLGALRREGLFCCHVRAVFSEYSFEPGQFVDA